VYVPKRARTLPASGEDVTLVVGNRDLVVSRGVKGMPLTIQNFKQFWTDFNIAEMTCPPGNRKTDDELKQLVGRLFFTDTAMRKIWSDSVNQPPVMGLDAAGAIVRVSGPPQNFADAKKLDQSADPSAGEIRSVTATYLCPAPLDSSVATDAASARLDEGHIVRVHRRIQLFSVSADCNMLGGSLGRSEVPRWRRS